MGCSSFVARGSVPGASKRQRRREYSPIVVMLHLRQLLLALVVVGASTALAARWYHTTRPDYQLLRGQEALRVGDVPAAEDYAASLALAGAREHEQLLRLEIHLRGRHYNLAVGAFNQFDDQTSPHAVAAAALLGQAFLIDLKRPVDAERLFRLVVSKQPESLEAHRGLAAIYYDQGAWILAAKHLLEWGGLDPADGRPFRLLGLIYRDMDQPKIAIPAYEEALRRDLKDLVRAEVKEELAECLVKQAGYEQALALLGECGPRADQEPLLLALRGDCLIGLQRDEEARSLLDKGLSGHPASLDLLRVRTKLHVNRGEHAQALELLQRLLALDPLDHASHYQLGMVCERLGQLDRAKQARQREKEIKDSLLAMTSLIYEVAEKPWDARLHTRLAETCQKLGKPELAERWLRSAAACPQAKP
jgi:tetratricopeptide (TPR) repeat protein